MMKQGVYVGLLPTVLEDGRPVVPGDTIAVDSASMDAWIINQMTRVEDVQPRRRRKKESGE